MSRMKRFDRVLGVVVAAALCVAGVVAEEAEALLAGVPEVRAEAEAKALAAPAKPAALSAAPTEPSAPAEPAALPAAPTEPAAPADASQAADVPAHPKGSTKFAGLEGVKDQQTVITSSRIEFDYKEMVAVFDENVRVENPQFLMLADRVLIFLDGTNDVKQILALGRVSVTNELRSASCDKAVYTRAADQLVLTGNAELRRGGDYVKGDRIAIWLNDERMEVSPGTFVIAPETIKERQEPDGDKQEPRQ